MSATLIFGLVLNATLMQSSNVKGDWADITAQNDPARNIDINKRNGFIEGSVMEYGYYVTYYACPSF